MKFVWKKLMVCMVCLSVLPAFGMQQEQQECIVHPPLYSLDRSVAVILSAMTAQQAFEYIERFANDMRCSVADYLDGRCGTNARIHAKRVMRQVDSLLSGIEWATHPSATDDSKQFWISFYVNAFDAIVEESDRAKNSALRYHGRVLQAQTLAARQRDATLS